MNILICPKCGASTLALQDNGNYLCLICNHEFNTEVQENKIKSITFESRKEKALRLPNIKNDVLGVPTCLCLRTGVISCKGIMCNECFFFLENYRQFLKSKGE